MSQYVLICTTCGERVKKPSSHVCDVLTKKCTVCGQDILKKFTTSKKDWANQKFCSQSCSAKYKFSGLNAKKNYNWKGGRTVFPDGRVHIYKPDHPNATKKGYVFEHHLKMEEKLGRFLDKKKERVKHIDGNHGNNKIENLLLEELKLNSYKESRLNGEKRSIHRRVMEKELGRRLKKDEVVHHINGDRQDNRLENLEVMSNSEHARLHRLEQLNK